MSTPRDLAGLPVIVTGGARGIGLATVGRLARAGARVAVGDVDGELALSAAEVVADLTGAVVLGARLDVADPDSWQAFLKGVAVLGPIEVLVNNAGIMPLGPVLEGETFEFRGVISYRLDEDGRFADILVAYNSFTGTRRDGTTVELGLPH